MVREISGDEYEQAVGMHLVAFRKGAGKYVVKVVSVDKSKNLMRYEVMSGENKGRVRTAKYVQDRPIKVYDDESSVKAFFEV